MMKYLLLLIASVSFFACSSDDESIPTTPTDDLMAAPAFTLSSDDGGSISLSDYEGDVLVIFFFGSSCPPCKQVAPRIEADLHQAYGSNEDFSIIGVDQWNGNLQEVESFRSVTGVTFPLGLTGRDVTAAYRTTYDRLVVVNKDGDISYSGRSQATNDLSNVVSHVATLLAE